MEISKEYLKDLKVLHSTALDMGVDVSFYDTVSSIIESYDKAADEVNTRISVLSGAISAMTAVVGHTGDSGAIDKLKQERIRLAI